MVEVVVDAVDVVVSSGFVVVLVVVPVVVSIIGFCHFLTLNSCFEYHYGLKQKYLWYTWILVRVLIAFNISNNNKGA